MYNGYCCKYLYFNNSPVTETNHGSSGYTPMQKCGPINPLGSNLKRHRECPAYSCLKLQESIRLSSPVNKLRIK